MAAGVGAGYFYPGIVPTGYACYLNRALILPQASRSVPMGTQ